MAVVDCSAANTTAHALSTVVIYNIGGARSPTAVTPHITSRYMMLHDNPYCEAHINSYAARRSIDEDYLTGRLSLLGLGASTIPELTTSHFEAGDAGFAGLKA